MLPTADSGTTPSGNPLDYPLAHEPKTGDASVVEVAPGVLWLRMPLFASLPWINVWALADAGGWTIVDTGLKSPKTLEAWEQAFHGALAGAPVVRIIATHMHPDHVGMAGWIAERFQAPLWMSQLEYLNCRLMAADTGRKAPAEGIGFYRGAGWGEEAIERYKARFGAFGEMIYPLPSAYRRIVEGERLIIGAHSWTVVVGRGHSPEHACLYCEELQLLISGDQVLPKISSNVSVYPTEPEANPLRDWLHSLAHVRASVSGDVLVLPAHNSPFTGLHARLAQLADGHRDGLTKLREALQTPRRAVDVFASLFARPIRDELLWMATGETLAHLNYLWKAGEITRDTDAQGVWWWQRRG